MNKYSKIYPYTNENVKDLNRLYDFKDKNVLTVLGSGDQYFTSMLYGAKTIDVFDINTLTWYYFVLKFTALQNLSLDEFYDFIINSRYGDTKTYLKLRDTLGEDERLFLDHIIANKGDLKSNVYESKLGIIPYLEKNNYLKLQSLLRNRKLPTFYNEDITKLVLDKTYDIALLSNIFGSTPHTLEEYLEFAQNFPAKTIEVYYMWSKNYHKDVLLDSKYSIEAIPGTYEENDYILTLRK